MFIAVLCDVCLWQIEICCHTNQCITNIPSLPIPHLKVQLCGILLYTVLPNMIRNARIGIRERILILNYKLLKNFLIDFKITAPPHLTHSFSW